MPARATIWKHWTSDYPPGKCSYIMNDTNQSWPQVDIYWKNRGSCEPGYTALCTRTIYLLLFFPTHPPTPDSVEKFDEMWFIRRIALRPGSMFPFPWAPVLHTPHSLP